MNIDFEEILCRIIKYILIIIIITIIIYITPDINNKIKYGVFIGIVAATIYALYDYFIPAIPQNIKNKLKFI